MRKNSASHLRGIEKATGLRPEQIQSAHVLLSKTPARTAATNGSSCLQIVTKKPYDKDKFLAGLRCEGAKVKDGIVAKLESKMVAALHHRDTQLTVLHESLLDEFKKGASKMTEGVMKDAIAAAKSGKNALVAGLDPSRLPDDFFANAPAEVKPFFPLLKTKSIVLQRKLDKELVGRSSFR